jgi:outer membrane protein TolC
MKIRMLFLPLICLAYLATTVAAGEAPPAEPLPRLIDTALADNPELKATDARWRMFRERIAQARSYEDPMLMLKLQNGVVTDPFNFGKDSMTQKAIGISQQLPFWGKRALREEASRGEAESYRWTLEERRVELRRMVKEAWYRLYHIDRSIDIVERNIRILDDFITLAQTRYAVNQGAQTDILKAQVERSRLLESRITLEQQRATGQAALNALLYRPADTAVGPIPDPEITPLAQNENELRELAIANRPQIRSLQALVGKGEAELRLARREFYPDFNVSLEYMQRDPAMGGEGDDMYTLGLTFNLPVRRERRHAAVAEAESGIAMAKEELNTLKSGIDRDISDLLAQLVRRRKLAELYRTGIIPQAGQTLESATINYRVNKVDFMTLLDSRMTLFNYELEYCESLADYQMKLAQLEALVGKDLTAADAGARPVEAPPAMTH